jgi:hypothetical protein
MASDETRRARPDPTAQDSDIPAHGDTDSTGGAPTSSAGPRRTDPVEWANGPAKPGRGIPDPDPSTAPQISQPDPMATGKMTAMPPPGWDNRGSDRPAPGPGPGPGPGRPNGPGGWPQAGPPRGWPPPPGPPPPGPAHSWPPAGPVSAWPPPPPPAVEQKGPSNRVLAFLLAGVVALAGGLLFWATGSGNSYVPPPTAVSDAGSSSVQPFAPPIAAPPSTTTPPPPPPSPKPTVRRIAPVRTPVRIAPRPVQRTTPRTTTSKPSSTKSTKSTKSKSSSRSNSDNSNDDSNNDDNSGNIDNSGN